MDSPYFSSNTGYLQLAYVGTTTIQRPANTVFSDQTVTLPYTDTGYTPMILAFWKDPSGNLHRTKTTFSSSTDARPLSPYLATAYASSTSLFLGAFGSGTDGTTYSIEITYYVFVNSVVEA